MAAKEAARVVIEALPRRAHADPGLGDQLTGLSGPSAPLLGLLLLQFACGQGRMDVSEQIAQGVREGADTVFGASEAHRREDHEVHREGHDGPDEDQEDDLPSWAIFSGYPVAEVYVAKAKNAAVGT